MSAAAEILTTGSHVGTGLERIDPLVGGEWDQHVCRHPEHTVFHRSAWARVLSETYGHRPLYLRISTGGAEAALVPIMEIRSRVTGRRGVSLPFSDFAGPLLSLPEPDPLIDEVLRKIAVEKKWRHLELRGGRTPVLPAVFRSYQSHQLDLRPGIDRISKSLDECTRRSIRRSDHSGLAVCIGENNGDVETFYQLHSRTRRRHGLPPQPFSFFDALGRHLIGAGLGFVVLARLSGRAVAGALFLRSGNRAVFKFGASDKDSWPLRPNHGVMWRAIRHLVETGCEHLDFGRTTGTDAGLARFKESWGSATSVLPYYRYHVAGRTWISGASRFPESMPGIFGHLPLTVNRLAGRVIYPHLD